MTLDNDDEARMDTMTELDLADPVPVEAPNLPTSARAPALRAETETQSLLPAIIQVARDPNLDVTKLDALMKMQFEMEKRQAEREAIEAFTRVSARLPRVKKNGTIDLGKGKPIPFATWEDMDQVIRPIITAEGFTLSFNTAPREGGGLVVTGELMHRSGHVRSAVIPLPLDSGPGRNNLQAVGSTLSYGKRYCAEMLLNIVREGADDDGVKGGTRLATQDEVAEIREMIRKTGSDERRFCLLFGVEELEELPVANVLAAKNMLAVKMGRSE